MIRPDDSERERVKTLLEREEVRAELEKHGILPHEAAARVDAMTPAEVQQLAGRIDALAAGGQSTQQLLLVIIIILLIIIIL
ncbi:MAG TPA: PA2779 family protein, partial [Burkholderiales bacterium]